MEKTTVKEIHGEFYDFPTNVGKVLQDLDLNLAKDKEVYEKSKKLQEMGFRNANQIDDPETTFEYYKQEHEDIMDLTFKYPGWKFISRRGIEHISNKYGLFHGSIEHFTGNIPEKNMNDIFNSEDKMFTKDTVLRIEVEMKSNVFIQYHGTPTVKGIYDPDADSDSDSFNYDKFLTSFERFYNDHKKRNPDTYIIVKIIDNHGNVHADQSFGGGRPSRSEDWMQPTSNNTITNMDLMLMQQRDLQHRQMTALLSTNSFGFMGGAQSRRERDAARQREDAWDAARQREDAWEKRTEKKWAEDCMRNINDAYAKAQKNLDAQYSIIANHSDFDKLVGPEGETITIEVPEIQLPDPVVLKKTFKKGYYAIITAWDKEAMDPLVFNEKLN